MRIPRRLLTLVGTAVVAGTLALTGVGIVPVEWALGPCLRDWANPSSYAPREIPIATHNFWLGTEQIRVCYGRPSASGRSVFGSLVPFGELWEAGANEPTRLYTATPIIVGGVRLEPGRYSIYAEPQPDRWKVFVSRSTYHWGRPSATARAEEIGATTVPVQRTDDPIDTFTIRSEPGPNGATLLVLEWEHTRVKIPVRSADRGA